MNHKRGMAIEYVILMMLLVTGLVAALLISASYSSQKAKSQRDYIERKAFLDESAQTYIDFINSGDDATDFDTTTLNQNEYGFVFVVATNKKALTATKKNGTVALYVELEQNGTEYELVAYRYS